MAEPVNIFSRVSVCFLEKLSNTLNSMLAASGHGDIKTNHNNNQIILHRREREDAVAFEIIDNNLYQNFQIDRDLFLPCLGSIKSAPERAVSLAGALNLVAIIISCGEINNESVINSSKASIYASFRHH